MDQQLENTSQFNQEIPQEPRSKIPKKWLIVLIIGIAVVAVYFVTTILIFVLTREDLDKLPSNPANWKTYRNEEFGFEVRYPEKFDIEQSQNSLNIKRNQNSQLTIFINPVLGLEGTKAIDKRIYNLGGIKVEADILIDDPIYNLTEPSKYIVLDIEKGGNSFIFKVVFPMDDSEGEQIFNQILSTFKFID